MKAAKLIAYGRDQAVRLPRELRFEGREVRIRRFGLGLILGSMRRDVETFTQHP